MAPSIVKEEGEVDEDEEGEVSDTETALSEADWSAPAEDVPAEDVDSAAEFQRCPAHVWCPGGELVGVWALRCGRVPCDSLGAWV